ncbi:MAG TPA: histidinol-phosphate transaminase, partial [Bacteroidales bacterium]|nr:histidinol-phosphate transaminase [Bacteroidales bacterium]
RDNIQNLQPYSSARSEYSGTDAIFLDANENPNNAPFNRYPDPLQLKIKHEIAKIKGIPADNLFLGNGSDEAIDLLIRAFCQPGVDNILSIDPTYGMYQVCADINEVRFNRVLLTSDFQLDVSPMLKMVNQQTKLIFLCSPNNPTSNSFVENDIKEIIDRFEGLVVLDEAYVDFSRHQGFLQKLPEYQNLVILQTFSKAWGLAGIRLGMCFADSRVIAIMNKIKYPYNVNRLTLAIALEALVVHRDAKVKWIEEILGERGRISRELLRFPCVLKVFPSDANFLLVRVKNPKTLYEYLRNKRIIVRDRSKVSLCEGCLRFTVGTKAENDLLLKALEEID